MEKDDCLVEQQNYDEWTRLTDINIINRFNAPHVTDAEKYYTSKAEPTKLLDIGCGNGERLFDYLSERNIPFLGIEKFQKLTIGSRFISDIIVEDLLNLNVNDFPEQFKNIDVVTILGGSLNGVFCFENHLKVWEKIVEILPVGGRIILDVLLIDGFEIEDKIGTRRLFEAAPPQFFLSEKQLKSIWKDFNLGIRETSDHIIPNPHKLRYYLLERK